MRKSWPFAAVTLVFILAFAAYRETAQTSEPAPRVLVSAPVGAGARQSEYLLCSWNVENFFDDRDDHRTGPGDREYDGWYAAHPDIMALKLDHLCKALLGMNNGKGPDIIALYEVESVRAAELLKDALNARLRDPALAYQNVLMKEVDVGRHIAPAIITRLPVVHDRTRQLGKRQRIIEGHIVVDGQDLIIIAAHWTSQLNSDSEKGRTTYADKIYGEANAIYHRNPAADIVICGDFNETPQAPALVNHMHAVTDRRAVAEGRELRFFNLIGDRDPQHFGTHYYRAWLIYDQILASPGLLDNQGWSCDPDSLTVVNSLTRPTDKHHRPWRFGNEHERTARGYSDHFPVTVKLRVARR